MTFKHQQKCTGNSGSKPTQRHLEVGLARRLRRCNLTSEGLRVFEYDSQNRHSKTIARDPDEGSKITYLHNALGQRVFKSEPKVDHVAPSATALGQPFIDWLQNNFGWLFAQAQLDATLGQSYVYDDGQLGSTPMLLGEYGNGGTNSAGRAEYIWLPTEDGQAIPIGMHQNLSINAVHADHLGTPRRVVSANGVMLWQWPYSAFGEDKPMSNLTGITNPAMAYTTDTATGTHLLSNRPHLAYNLRFPGQYFDSESNLNQNYFRSYQASQGRYSQSDPIGLAGGLNRFGYANQNSLSFTDPTGELAFLLPFVPSAVGWGWGSAAVGAGAVMAVGSIPGSSPNGRVDDPAAATEHDEYKRRYKEPPPPSRDPCDELRWRLKREEDLLRDRHAWNMKWLPGRHAGMKGEDQSQNAIRKLKEKMKLQGCDCP